MPLQRPRRARVLSAGFLDDLVDILPGGDDEDEASPDYSKLQEADPVQPSVPREERPEPERVVRRFGVSGQARVSATSLRMRKEPSTSADTVVAMPQNTIVNVGPSEPGWAYVEWQSYSGFASNQYLEPVGGPDWDPKPIPPPAPAPATITPRPAPAPPPAPPPAPAPKGIGLAEKLFVAALVLTIVGVPTFLLLKRKAARSYA
jgi:hypothetical protein